MPTRDGLNGEEDFRIAELVPNRGLRLHSAAREFCDAANATAACSLRVFKRLNAAPAPPR